MRAPRFPTLLLGLALTVALAGSACRTTSEFGPDNPEPEAVMLIVKNDNVNAMHVYALSSGLATRVGTVNSLSTEVFKLAPTLYGSGDFRVLATPPGGNGRASSQQLNVTAGQTIHFTIGTRLSQSIATVR